MSEDPRETSAEPPPEAGDGAAEPDEAELQRRLEEQIRDLRVQDLLLESVASILNLAARRIGKADERDLEQGRVGIEAVRAVLDLLEPNARQQVREALSQVQVLYAREAQGDAPRPEAVREPHEPAAATGDEQPKVERPSRLWTPPGS